MRATHCTQLFCACFFRKKLLIVHMTIWLLAILLLAALAAFGFRQGAIRVLLSFLGIVIGGLLAAPLGHLIKPLLAMAGVKHPVWLAMLPPCIGFLIVLTIFKIAGALLNQKLELRIKYKSNDLQLAMWERLNHRLGLCLGLFNGAAYLVLLSASIYLLSYWTVQMASGENDPKSVRLMNTLGEDLQRTGMNRVAVSVNHAPPTYFQAADIVGLVYKNPLLQARLSRYPALLSLAERPEFQDLANDKNFTELQLRQAPIIDIVNYPKVQAIIQNPQTVKAVEDTLLPNLQDLRAYLETGKSQVYTETILGRWDFDVLGTMILIHKAHPNLTAPEVARSRTAFSTIFTKAVLVAAPGNTAVLKNYPHVTPGNPPTVELQNCQGHWTGGGGTYTVTLSIEGKDRQFTGEIKGDRLGLASQDLNFGFVRED